MRLRFFCLLFSGSCSRHYVFTSFWETKLKCSGGGGNQTTLFFILNISDVYLAVTNVLKFLSENASFGTHIKWNNASRAKFVRILRRTHAKMNYCIYIQDWKCRGGVKCLWECELMREPQPWVLFYTLLMRNVCAMQVMLHESMDNTEDIM